MKEKLRQLFSKKLYWYQVEFQYRKENHKPMLFSWEAHVGLSDQADVLESRIMKMSGNNLYFIDGVPKNLLCNGVLSYNVKAYLGRFARRNDKLLNKLKKK